MSLYLMKYKGKYRILPELDLISNDVPRDKNGDIIKEFDDIYISCPNGSKIYHYGGRTLVGYIPSLGRGHNVIKEIAKIVGITDEEYVNNGIYNYNSLYSNDKLNSIIFDILENDKEVEFKFKVDNIDTIARILKAKTFGASISPFSTKNLPKSDYTLPDEEFQKYKEIISIIPMENILIIHKITTEFLSNVLEKKLKKRDKKFNYKFDMKKVCMSRQAKEYIYMRGFWQEYLSYLKENIEVKINEQQ